MVASSEEVIGVFGYSCSLPGCEDFRALLMGHETGIWPHAPDSQNFDHVFFGVPKQIAEKCDPQLRKLLECTYHALLRSAIGEQELEHRREKFGVYVGSCSSDYMGILCGTACAESEGITGSENLGAQRAMFANRISEVFDLRGPSMSIDTTCSSGLTALVSACEAIERGEIDLAVVGASSVLLDSSVTDAYSRLGMLSSGDCLPFCKGADGYVRAEGTVVLVIGSIRSASSAARAHIVGFGCNSNGGCKATPITAPSVEMQVRLCRRVLAQARLRPNSVDYVECHATGTQKGDAAECEALERVFFSKGDTTKCEASVTRRCPFLLGAVKGTTGHTEEASGLVGVLRVILSMESGMFARNRHYAHENRNPNIQLLEDPTVAKVVEENTPFSADGDIVALVSAFSFGGRNAQVLLRSGSFNKRGETSSINDDEKWKSINALCGRTETTVRKSLEFLSSTNRQYEGLLEPQPLQRVQSPAFAVRGFSVGKDVYLREPCQNRGREKKRPIVLLFSGNGQDIDMDVLRHQSSQSRVWCETWARCRQHVLSAYRLDLDFYNHNDSEAHDTHDHIVLTTLVLVALQVCQVEWLREVAVEVSFYLGHSSGEIPMAYADGVLTLEQALSVAYLRVEHALRAKAHALEPHCMLALGLSVREFQECDGAEGVEVACENSEHLITIAGRRSLVDDFLEKLAFNPPPRKVHHKFLNTGGIAYHSAFVDGDAPEGGFDQVDEYMSDLRQRGAPQDDWGRVLLSQHPRPSRVLPGLPKDPRCCRGGGAGCDQDVRRLREANGAARGPPGVLRR